MVDITLLNFIQNVMLAITSVAKTGMETCSMHMHMCRLNYIHLQLL